jgi:hypothetical protein
MEQEYPEDYEHMIAYGDDDDWDGERSVCGRVDQLTSNPADRGSVGRGICDRCRSKHVRQHTDAQS